MIYQIFYHKKRNIVSLSDSIDIWKKTNNNQLLITFDYYSTIMSYFNEVEYCFCNVITCIDEDIIIIGMACRLNILLYQKKNN